MDRTRIAVGCMTGTSLDGLDAACVAIDGSGLSMHARFLAGVSRPLGDLAKSLRPLAQQTPTTAGDIAKIASAFTTMHAAAVRDVLVKASLSTCDLICVHGQTVFHAPPHSWQLFQPAPLALALNAPVVFDLRQADLAAGGQGAPITPLADWVLFRDQSLSRVVINLGGFCNITRLPAACTPEQVAARDVCACNQVLDAVARFVLDRPFDEGGRAASTGHAHAGATADIAESLAGQAQAAGRALGTGDELYDFAQRWRGRLTPADIAASAASAVASTIAKACQNGDELILAGGGVKNAALVSELTGAARRLSPNVQVRLCSDLGIPCEMREAACFAVLGALCQDHVPITLPQVTGVASPAPIGGCWCPAPFPKANP
ncbi:MAG: anhydro-N-acetylmuramic acid kinase [Phycisphaerales bacterium]|jgi:1,6-anhydro-N-acetylmuramate kinase